MDNKDKVKELQTLVQHFDEHIEYYKDIKNAYNEQSTRIEYIDPFLKILGWDVANEQGVAPQYREVIVEKFSDKNNRPDYTMTLRGVQRFFVEAKKPAVDITVDPIPAVQARRYGWNAKHKIVILTNFENLVIYDTTVMPKDGDSPRMARFRQYNYKEYVEKFDEISSIISHDTVYSDKYDTLFNPRSVCESSQKQEVDEVFLEQINKWRVALSNELYFSGKKELTDFEILNDVVQKFINQILFLRICEDRNISEYHRLFKTVQDEKELKKVLTDLFKKADKTYNSGLFAGENILFDLNSNTIKNMVEELYYPNSPYLFNIIEPNILGKIYELFLTEQLTLMSNGKIGLALKKDCKDRSVVTTPIEIVKYIVEETLTPLCKGKNPDNIKKLHIADIACGSGIFLEEAFDFLQNVCIKWYIENDEDHLEYKLNGEYKLSYEPEFP